MMKHERAPFNPIPFKTVENNNQEPWASEEEMLYCLERGFSNFIYYWNQ